MSLTSIASGGSDAERRTGFRWVVAALIFVVYMVASADRANIGFALPFIRKEFTMSNAQAGGLVSLFLFGYAIMQIPSGFLLRRTGVRFVMPVAMVLTSVFTGLVGFSQTALSIKVYRFALGIAEGPLPVGMATTINNWFPKKEKGIASGIFLSAVKFGPVIVPPICAGIISIWGWRAIFFVFAVPGLLFAAMWYFLVPDSPSASRFCSQSERDYISGTGHAGQSGGGSVTIRPVRQFKFLDRLIRARWVPILEDGKQVFRSGAIWGCAIGYSFQLGITNVLLAWMPTYLLDVKKFSVIGTGFVAAAPWIGAVCGNLLGGWFSDRVLAGRRKPGMLFSALATCGMMLTLLHAPADPTLYGILLFVTGVMLSFGYAAYMAYPMSVTSKAAFPIASALVNTGGQLGGACAPLVVGLLLDRLGWSSAFVFMATGSLLSFAVVLLIPEPMEKEMTH